MGMRHAGQMDLAQVRAELEQMVREADAAILASAAEEEEGDLDDADLSAELAEADREEALVEAADSRREDALAALARLDAGTYGVCIDCGQQIDVARLEFRPEAARCLVDQQAFEDHES
jgi:RNA polymerase-binding transcription factor DksA